MVHCALKQRFRALDAKHLTNSVLLPIPEAMRLKFGLSDEFKDVARLNYILVVTASLYNRFHPGGLMSKGHLTITIS